MNRASILSLFLCLLAACGGRAPSPLTLEEIPSALKTTFQTAKEDRRSLAEAISRLIERKQFGPASMQLQGMLGDRSLNEDQRTLIARALITINSNLQKQIEIQEATVSAPPTESPRRASTPQMPDPAAATDEQSAAEARAVMELYRRTK